MNDEVRIEKFDICAVFDGGKKLAIKMIIDDNRYLVKVFPLEKCIGITSILWQVDQSPLMEAIRKLRSMPYMLLEDVVLALDGDFYQVTITDMTDDGDFKASVTILFPDDRIGTVVIDLHEALSLALNRGIIVHAEEQVLDRFARHLLELPRWYNMQNPVTREVLHATHPERLATLPEAELKFFLDKFNEQEDYESAALLHKALLIKDKSEKQQ